MLNLVWLLCGVALLTLGGEALIRGALALARRLRVSPLLAGLVIVGFGTSTPELVVSIDAALARQPDIAIGNVVGSNIGNILLILGLCALITPLGVTPQSLRRDGFTMSAVALLFIVLAMEGELGRGDALILLLGLGGYLVWAYWSEAYRGDPAGEVHQHEAEEMSALPSTSLTIGLAVVGGLCLLIVGSRVLLHGAVGLSQSWGVPEAVIGLTLVAVGTSIPELAVSLLAAIRRHADVAVGNILGSNIFNVLGILGVSSMLQPLSVHARIVSFDQWFMLAASLVLVAFLFTGYRLNRWEGGLLLLGYVIYLGLGLTLFAA